MRPPKLQLSVIVVLATANVVGGKVRAEYLPVFGGPKDGINWGESTFIPTNPVRVNNTGTALGVVGITLGEELSAVFSRFDGSGAPPELLSTISLNGQIHDFIGIVEDINDAGVAVGSGGVRGSPVGGWALRWDPGGTHATVIDGLGPEPDDFPRGYARAINSAGVIVGEVITDDSEPLSLRRPVRWDADNAVAAELPAPIEFVGTNYSSHAVDINDKGVAIGWIQTVDVATPQRAGVRWDASGRPVILIGIDPNGSAPNYPLAISDSGVAVGNGPKYDASGKYLGDRAIRWEADENAATELHGLGSRADGYEYTHAWTGINDHGDIVGKAEKFDEFGNSLGVRAVRWDAGQVDPFELDHLGYGSGDAYAINAAGVSVGGLRNGRYEPFDRAVYWNRDGTAVDLNTLIDPDRGWTLRYATDISNTGWIAGWGAFERDGPGYRRMFLIHVPAAAVPEPVLLVLLTIAAASLCLSTRRCAPHSQRTRR